MPAKAGVAPTGVILYFSIAKLPNLVLDQPSGCAGKLIHAADARHIFAVDLRGGTGAHSRKFKMTPVGGFSAVGGMRRLSLGLASVSRIIR